MAESIRITDENAIKTVEKYAAEKGISAPDAAARLISTAKGRLNAVRKYAAEHPAKPKPKKAKAPAKPKAKKKAKPAKEPTQQFIPGTEIPV